MPRALILLLCACGASTGLPGSESNADAGDVSLESSVEPACRTTEDCVDGVACTSERCVGGRCTSTLEHERCVLPGFCAVGRCDALRGCVSEPVACDDGVACTVDACSDASGGCTSTPDDSLCPTSHRCDPSEGCLAIAWSHDSDSLYQVDVPSGLVTRLASIESYTDIALDAEGVLYGVGSDAIYRIDLEDGSEEFVLPVTPGAVALEVGADGSFYVAGAEPAVYRHTLDGEVSVAGRFPPGWFTSGDIAFIGERLLVTVTNDPGVDTGTNAIIEVREDESELLVTLGETCLWGIAAFGDELYGFSCFGALYAIDLTSGATILSPLGFEARGAAAR